MTKIYEALENANRGQSPGMGSSMQMPGRGAPPKPIERTMMSLGQRFESLIKDQQNAVIGFIGAQPGPDSARLLGQFARVAADRQQKRVLVLASDPFSPVHRVFPSQGLEGWEAVIEEGQQLEDLLKQVDDRIMVGQIALSDTTLPSLLRSPQFPVMLQSVRDSFDLVLVDIPAMGTSANAGMLAAAVDGVAVVVEARRTRWQVVQNTIEQINEQQGKVLGVVLNKRRFYIPNFIYRRL